jgi:sigma-B regulation protein RsbU (phosphoserine phosphatase)
MSAPVLSAIVKAAVDATGANAGWLLAVGDGQLTVAAVAGEAPASLLGNMVAAGSGAGGYVVESGQPLAVTPRGDDPRFAEGLAAALGRSPSSLVCVPCESGGEIPGALELIDKSGGGPFSFDDLEMATLLAGIAGSALANQSSAEVRVPEPAALSGSLAALAQDDPARYATIAALLGALIDGA